MARTKSLLQHRQEFHASDYEFHEYLKKRKVIEDQQRRALNDAKHIALNVWWEDMPDLQDEALAQAEQEFVDTSVKLLNIKHGSR